MRNFTWNAPTFLFLFSLSSAVLTGCAHQYKLHPTAEKPEVLNGIPLETLVTPKCVIQAGFQDSNADEMLVRVRMTNKSDTVGIDPALFTLGGSAEVLKDAPLRAFDPDKYLRDLNTTAETLDGRTHMESHQGIEALADLKIGDSDTAINEAREELKKKQADVDASRKKAAAIRVRVAAMQTTAIRKSSLKKGETVEGLIIFPARFIGEGPVTLESENSGCDGILNFELKK